MPPLSNVFGGLFFLAYVLLIVWLVYLAVRSLVWMSRSLREISATLTDIAAALRTRDLR